MTDNQQDQPPVAVSPVTAQVDEVADRVLADGESNPDGTESIGEPAVGSAAKKRRRGSRGGRNRKRPAGIEGAGPDDDDDDDDDDNVVEERNEMKRKRRLHVGSLRSRTSRNELRHCDLVIWD